MTSIADKNVAHHLHDLAQQAFDKGESQIARPLWHAAIAKDPTNADYHVNLAKLEGAAGNDVEAERLWTSAVILAPTHYEYALGLAAAVNRRHTAPAGAAAFAPAPSAETLNACADAQRVFTTPTPTPPRPASPAAATVAPAASEQAESAAAPEHVSTPYGDDAEVVALRHFERGKALLEQKKIPAAIEAFEATIAADGSNPKYFYKLASVYHVHAKDLQAALPHYKQAVNFDPANPMWHNGLGVCLEEMGDLRAALQSIDYAHFVRPENALYKENVARLQGKVAAQTRAAEAQSQASADAKANDAKANDAKAPGTKPSSQKPADAAIADPLAPRASDTASQAAARRQLGVAYKQEAARRAQALKASPNDPSLLTETGYFHYVFGRFDEARALLAQARALVPTTPESVRFIVDNLSHAPADNFAHAVKMARHLDIEDALPYFMAAAEQAPSEGLYQSLLGLSLLHMGMIDDALAPLYNAYAAAKTPADRKAEAFNLALTLEFAGRPNEAADFHRKSGVGADIALAPLTARNRLKTVLSDAQAAAPLRSDIPGDGLVFGQGLEQLQAMLQMSTQSEPPRRSYTQPRPKAGRSEASGASAGAQRSTAGTGARFLQLPEHLQAGPSVRAADLKRTSRSSSAAVSFKMDDSHFPDLSAHGISSEHMRSVAKWFVDEYERKDKITLKKAGTQMAPVVLAGGIVIGAAAYKAMRIEIQKKRLQQMVDAINNEYARHGITFTYASRGLFVWQPQVGSITVNVTPIA